MAPSLTPGTPARRAVLLPAALLACLLGVDVGLLVWLAPSVGAVRLPEGPAASAPSPPSVTQSVPPLAPRARGPAPATVLRPAPDAAVGRSALATAGRAPGRWPLRPAIVVRGFDPPEQPWLAGHRGIDLEADLGQPVRTPRGGTITFAGPLAGRGVVVVSHGALRSTFEPVDAAVAAGDLVAAGEVVGWVASGTGHCGDDGPCLHWGLRRGETYLDPRLLVDGLAPVLLAP